MAFLWPWSLAFWGRGDLHAGTRANVGRIVCFCRLRYFPISFILVFILLLKVKWYFFSTGLILFSWNPEWQYCIFQDDAMLLLHCYGVKKQRIVYFNVVLLTFLWFKLCKISHLDTVQHVQNYWSSIQQLSNRYRVRNTKPWKYLSKSAGWVMFKYTWTYFFQINNITQCTHWSRFIIPSVQVSKKNRSTAFWIFQNCANLRNALAVCLDHQHS